MMVRGKPATKIQTGRRSTASATRSTGTPTPPNPAPNAVKPARTFIATGCTKCGVIISDDTKALQCDRCVADKWMCAQCLNLPGEMYDHLVSDQNCPLRWFCNECEKKAAADDTGEFGIWSSKMEVMFDKMDQILNRINGVENQLSQKADLLTLNKIEERLQKVESIVQENNKAMDQLSAEKLEGVLSLMEQRLQSVEHEVQDVQSAKKLENTQVMDYVDKVISTRTQDTVDEEAEKNRRKTNVIVHGLPESSAQDSAERETDDLGMVSTMLHAIKCDDVEVGQVVRLGKRPESASSSELQKPRPLKLVFRTEDHRTQVLKSAKNLRREEEGVWKGVHIHADLTMKEREARRKLVSEMKQRKEEGETDLIIAQGRIVKKWWVTRTAQD